MEKDISIGEYNKICLRNFIFNLKEPEQILNGHTLLEKGLYFLNNEQVWDFIIKYRDFWSQSNNDRWYKNATISKVNYIIDHNKKVLTFEDSIILKLVAYKWKSDPKLVIRPYLIIDKFTERNSFMITPRFELEEPIKYNFFTWIYQIYKMISIRKDQTSIESSFIQKE
jgi:hypothetical protein